MIKTFILSTLVCSTLLLAPTVNAAERIGSVVHLVDGWNLFAVSGELLSNPSDSTAVNLISEINRQGGRTTTVARFIDGKWEEVVKREDGQIYGTDFKIESGKSYFVRNYVPVDFKMVVSKPTTPFNLMLTPGYNFVSFPGLYKEGFKFSRLASELNSVLSQKEILLASFHAGLFESFLTVSGRSYGADQTIDPFSGYVIMVDQPVNYEINN